MKKLPILIVAAICGCTPAGTQQVAVSGPSNAVRVYDGTGESATVQVVIVDGHKFAVAQNFRHGEIAICEVTEASITPEKK